MRLKVCGMKFQENIEAVTSLQPDYLGFIFYKKSARFFDGESRGFGTNLPENIKKVGVFVDASLDYILEKIQQYNLQAIQLHGDESPEFCDALRRHPKLVSASHQVDLIKVFYIKDTFDFKVLKPYETVCDYYLFDTKGKNPGGNGYTFNWEVLKNYPSTKPYFLSGGIGLDEVEKILSFLKSKESNYCYAIDVNSKFEIEPGLKDINKLKEFNNKLKNG